jgi:hypothetical protein
MDEIQNVIKKRSGGARKNAGAKPKFGEPTITISFRCPVSKADEMKMIIRENLYRLQSVINETQGR